MSWLDRQIAGLFPGLALRRQVAKMRLDRLQTIGTEKRSFDAVSGNRLRSDFITNRFSADSSLEGADKLRHHVRQLEQNNGFIAGPIARVVNNVVGLGFQFQSRMRPDENNYDFPRINEDDAAKFNYQMEKGFEQWSSKADKRLIHNFDFCLRLIEGALLRDGAALVIGRTSTRPDRVIPFCLDVFEIDRLQTPPNEVTNPRVRGGIEYDEEGVPKLYYVLKNHPGDMRIGLERKLWDFEEIPAYNPNGTKKVFHLFNAVRPEQTLGYSAFAAALKDYQDLDRYREAEIMAALEAACLTGFVKTPDPTGFQQGRTLESMSDNPDAGGTSRRIHEFSPAEWHYLNPGEDIEIFHPTRPTEMFDKFTKQLLAGPSNALDIPMEVLAQDWKDMNYSNARTVLLQFYLTCFVRRKYLIDCFCTPVYENVGRELIARGLVQARGFARRAADYMRHTWVTPGWAWVDPLTEARGKEVELNNNMETLANIAAGKGMDYEEHLEQRARELRTIKNLEERFGIEFPKGNQAARQEKEDDEDETEDKPAAKTLLKAVKK